MGEYRGIWGNMEEYGGIWGNMGGDLRSKGGGGG